MAAAAAPAQQHKQRSAVAGLRLADLFLSHALSLLDGFAAVRPGKSHSQLAFPHCGSSSQHCAHFALKFAFTTTTRTLYHQEKQLFFFVFIISHTHWMRLRSREIVYHLVVLIQYLWYQQQQQPQILPLLSRNWIESHSHKNFNKNTQEYETSMLSLEERWQAQDDNSTWNNNS